MGRRGTPKHHNERGSLALGRVASLCGREYCRQGQSDGRATRVESVAADDLWSLLGMSGHGQLDSWRVGESGAKGFGGGVCGTGSVSPMSGDPTRQRGWLASRPLTYHLAPGSRLRLPRSDDTVSSRASRQPSFGSVCVGFSFGYDMTECDTRGILRGRRRRQSSQRRSYSAPSDAGSLGLMCTRGLEKCTAEWEFMNQAGTSGEAVDSQDAYWSDGYSVIMRNYGTEPATEYNFHYDLDPSVVRCAFGPCAWLFSGGGWRISLQPVDACFRGGGGFGVHSFIHVSMTRWDSDIGSFGSFRVESNMHPPSPERNHDRGHSGKGRGIRECGSSSLCGHRITGQCEYGFRKKWGVVEGDVVDACDKGLCGNPPPHDNSTVVEKYRHASSSTCKDGDRVKGCSGDSHGSSRVPASTLGAQIGEAIVGVLHAFWLKISKVFELLVTVFSRCSSRGVYVVFEPSPIEGDHEYVC